MYIGYVIINNIIVQNDIPMRQSIGDLYDYYNNVFYVKVFFYRTCGTQFFKHLFCLFANNSWKIVFVFQICSSKNIFLNKHI